MGVKWGGQSRTGARRWYRVRNKDLDASLTLVIELLKQQNALLQRLDIKTTPTVLRVVPPIGANLDDA